MKAAALVLALAAAQESPAERLERRVEAWARPVAERFVFSAAAPGRSSPRTDIA